MVFSLKSAVKPSKRSRVLVRKETTAAYLFLLPSLIFFLGFVIFPIVLCVWTSFFDSTMNSADVFVGLANYKELFQDKVFLGALKNTLIIVVVSVPITCVFFLMGIFRDRRSERMGNLLIQNCILSSGCNWFRSSYRCMEVDV